MAIDWAKWMRDCLAANKQLTQAGLARHLGHGRDQSKVSLMVKGKRRIKVEEAQAAAVYFGVPLPASSDLRSLPPAVREVPLMGLISRDTWHRRGGPKPQARFPVPPIEDPRYPIDKQVRYEMTDPATKCGFLVGDQLICVPFKDYRSSPQPNDIIVTERGQGDLVSHTLARAVTSPSGVSLESAMDTPTDTDLGKPIALVVGFYRSLT